MKRSAIYAKVIAATVAAVAGAVATVLVQAQADGVELADWVVMIIPVLVFLGGYRKTETRA